MSIVRFSPFRTPGFIDHSRWSPAGNAWTGRRPARTARPCDIEASGENRFRIRVVVPGYAREDLDIAVEGRKLTLSGTGRQTPADDRETADDNVRLVHKGIDDGAFVQEFALGEHVEITGATLDNGILTIELERLVPEALKPRSIAIGEPARAA